MPRQHHKPSNKKTLKSELSPSKDQLLPISEAARMLGVSLDTIRRWDKNGKLKSTRPDGKNRYFTTTDLEQLRKARTSSKTRSKTIATKAHHGHQATYVYSNHPKQASDSSLTDKISRVKPTLAMVTNLVIATLLLFTIVVMVLFLRVNGLAALMTKQSHLVSNYIQAQPGSDFYTGLATIPIKGGAGGDIKDKSIATEDIANGSITTSLLDSDLLDRLEASSAVSPSTLQTAYANKNTIVTVDNKDIALVLSDTITDSSLVVTTTTGSTGHSRFLLANGSGSFRPTQLVYIANQDTNLLLPNGIVVRSGGGGITDGLDVSDPDIVNALNIGSNVIIGTTPAIDFTNFELDSTGSIVAAGDIAVNGGDITSSNDLNITPQGTLTVGSTGQPATFKGSVTTIASNGSGNDIILNSADSIRLTGFNCTTFGNGGALTTDTSGNLSCSDDEGVGDAPTLQAVYNNGNVITTTDARNVSITLADTATDQVFEITQAGTANAVRVNDDGTFSDSTPFVIDSTGNVGIGLAGPSEKLQIAGNIAPEAAGVRSLGTSTLEFSSLFLGDNTGLSLGLDQDATLAYDETGDDRVELTGARASLFLEDRLALGTQSTTVPSDGTIAAAVLNLTPTSSFVEINCQDPDGCLIHIQDSSAKPGDLLFIANISANGVTIVETEDVINGPGSSMVLGLNDTTAYLFSNGLANNLWVGLFNSNN